MATQIHEFYFGVVKMIFYKWAQIIAFNMRKQKCKCNFPGIRPSNRCYSRAYNGFCSMKQILYYMYITHVEFSPWMGCYYPLLGFPSLTFTGSICVPMDLYTWEKRGIFRASCSRTQQELKTTPNYLKSTKPAIRPSCLLHAINQKPFSHDTAITYWAFRFSNCATRPLISALYLYGIGG